MQLPTHCVQAWALTQLTNLAMAGALLGFTLQRLLEWLAEPGAAVGERYRPDRPPQMLALWPAVEGGHDDQS